MSKFKKSAVIRIGEMILNKYPDGILNKSAKEAIKKIYKEAGIGKPKGTPTGTSGKNPSSKSGLSKKGDSNGKKGVLPNERFKEKAKKYKKVNKYLM